ncbi:hypothetical protein GMSM_40120 [Geomonas sp. Red276]
MVERTKRPPIGDIVTVTFQVHRSNAELVIKYARELEEGESRPWREVLGEVRPGEDLPSMILRGSRSKEDLTQVELAEKAGISRRHLGEMENGKRSIGKEMAKKLATALDCDYRLFL